MPSYACRLALALVLATSTAWAADWPQFRGPSRDGISPETGLARTWPAGGPKELWRLNLGDGFAGVIAAGDRVWTLTGDAEFEYAVCFDAATGKELWRTKLSAAWLDDVGLVGPRSTPTLSGETLYLVDSRSAVHAIEAATGAVRFKVDLLERFAVQVPRFGYSPSPLVHGGLVLVDAGAGEGKAYAALDAATGATRWTVGDGRTGYTSPIVANLGGEELFVFVGRKILGVRANGAVAWTTDSLPGVIVSPVLIAPDRIFVSATDDVGGVVYRVVPGDPVTVEEVWRNKQMKNHFSTSIAHGGAIYGFDNGTLKAIDAATGSLLWARRGYGKGSLTIADGLLVVLSDMGKLVLAEASTTAFAEAGVVQAFTGSKSWTAPSVAGGRIFVRNQKELVAYDARPPAG